MHKYIVAFQSTHDAFSAQDQLATHRVDYVVIPTPVEISANCGIALMIEFSVIDQVKEILALVSSTLYVEAQLEGAHITPVL